MPATNPCGATFTPLSLPNIALLKKSIPGYINISEPEPLGSGAKNPSPVYSLVLEPLAPVLNSCACLAL